MATIRQYRDPLEKTFLYLLNEKWHGTGEKFYAKDNRKFSENYFICPPRTPPKNTVITYIPGGSGRRPYTVALGTPASSGLVGRGLNRWPRNSSRGLQKMSVSNYPLGLTMDTLNSAMFRLSLEDLVRGTVGYIDNKPLFRL